VRVVLTSPHKRSSPRSPPTRPSSTSPLPSLPSPKSPPNDHLANPLRPTDRGATAPTRPRPAPPPTGPRHAADVSTARDAAVATLNGVLQWNRGEPPITALDRAGRIA
jgi:hypothetical protein